jgi:geranylgeranyl diphosphate synthase type II
LLTKMITLKEIQNLLDKKFSSLKLDGTPPELYAPISYTVSWSGKRIRPVLLLIACDLFGGNTNIASDSAVGLELFHNFTLIHDDIMDNAPLRRGKPTVFKKWDSNIAILSGDTMFALAYKQVIRTKSPFLKKILDVFTQTAVEVCEGQQMDLNFESVDNVSIEEYLNMIRLKTAVLIGASLKIGALIAGADKKNTDIIYKFGENIGMAFQLQDDYLDAFGDEKQFGKKTGGDIIENKKTYLYLKACEISDKKNLKILNDLYKNNYHKFTKQKKIKTVKNIFLSLGVNKHIENEINLYFKKALYYLEKIPFSDKRKEILMNFSGKLMHRNT